MTTGASPLVDRGMNALLAGLAVMAFITELRALFLDRVKALILLMAPDTGHIMARRTVLACHSFMDIRPGHLALVTAITGFAADLIDSSGRFRSHTIRCYGKCQSQCE